MAFYREGAAAVVHEGYLYVIGGTGFADPGVTIVVDQHQWENDGCPVECSAARATDNCQLRCLYDAL